MYAAKEGKNGATGVEIGLEASWHPAKRLKKVSPGLASRQRCLACIVFRGTGIGKRADPERQIDVQLPPTAELWFDGQKTKQTGVEPPRLLPPE